MIKLSYIIILFFSMTGVCQEISPDKLFNDCLDLLSSDKKFAKHTQVNQNDSLVIYFWYGNLIFTDQNNGAPSVLLRSEEFIRSKNISHYVRIQSLDMKKNIMVVKFNIKNLNDQDELEGRAIFKNKKTGLVLKRIRFSLRDH